MNIGTIFRLQIEGTKRRLSSELIGVDDGNYLIVKMPPIHTMENVSNLLVKGNKVTVKYMHKGTMFGFQSTIIDLIHKLNPKPGEGNIASEEANQVTPDFLIEKIEILFVYGLRSLFHSLAIALTRWP